MPQSVSLLEKEIKRGRESLGAGWPWHLFLFMLAVAGLSVFIYAGMFWGYTPYLESSIHAEDQKLDDLGNSFASPATTDLFRFYSELVNTQKILKAHTVGSKVLDTIENNLYSNVYLTSLDLQSPSKTIRLTGVARDYESLGAELTLLGRASGITSTLLEDSSMRDRGDVQFTIRLTADPSLFNE